MRILEGRGISPGMAAGKAFVHRDMLHQDIEPQAIEPHAINSEYARVEKARDQVLQDLEDTAERVESDLDEERADIFRAQADMLRSGQVMAQIREDLESELASAGRTVRHVLGQFEQHFAQMDDPVFRARADDLADIARRLLRALSGGARNTLAELPPESIVVASRLLPSETVGLARDCTRAVVVEHGGPVSHAALLTREMGIPAVAEVRGLLDIVQPGDRLLVDGSAGTITVDPDEAALASFERRRQAYQRDFSEAHRRRHEPAVTRNGNTAQVHANIATREDAVAAADSGAAGIGLYRVEDLYLPRHMPPTEEELLDVLRDVLTPVKDKPITIRLLDVGGDKQPAFLNLPAEPNPLLGRRGVRILLAYPDLLRTQLRALLRLSDDFDLRVLVPMVTLVEELEHVRHAFAAAGRELGLRKHPPLGAMIETPSAALCASELAAAADFISVGTNDLTQYTMVAGRDESTATDYYLEDHPAVWKLLGMIAQAAAGKSLTLCGELAGRTERLGPLMALGMTSFSVPVSLVATVKAAVRELEVAPRLPDGE